MAAPGGKESSEEVMGLGWGPFPEILRNSFGLRSSYIPPDSQRSSRHCHVEGQEDKEKRWKVRKDLGIHREGGGGDAKRPKLALDILKRTCLTPQPKRWDWNSPAGLGRGQIIRGTGRVPLEHCSPF